MIVTVHIISSPNISLLVLIKRLVDFSRFYFYLKGKLFFTSLPILVALHLLQE